MSSPSHTPPSPSISDVMDLLSTMKKQNDEAMKEILTKLTCLEEDNRKLKKELQDMKNYQNHGNNISSKKRDERDAGAEHKNENSNNKKARVTVASLPPEPETEPGPAQTLAAMNMFGFSASFNTLDDDCLGNVLEFVGKKCYSAFGRVDKRCHEMFCSKGLPKETYLYGYAPLHIILQHPIDIWDYCDGLSKGVLHYNRRDILEWILPDESRDGYERLKWLCNEAIEESRLDILRLVFHRVNERQLERLKKESDWIDLCGTAALYGKFECMKLLRENECEWSKWTWYHAKDEGHEHILQYLRNNGFPTEWQVDSLSEFDY